MVREMVKKWVKARFYISFNYSYTLFFLAKALLVLTERTIKLQHD